MKKLLIIFLFFSSVVMGQTFQWDSTQTIIYPTNTTAKIPSSIGNDTIYAINVDTIDAQNNIQYINMQSGVLLIYGTDTIPAAIKFQNEGFDSLRYYRIEEKLLNSDNTMDKPKRITEIEFYSTATDRMSYFEVPFVPTATMYRVPEDYIDVQAAHTAASDFDTIIVSGEHGEGNFLTVNKKVTIIGLGDWVLTHNSGQGQSIFLDDDNIKLENCWIQSNSATYAIYNTNQTNNYINSTYMQGFSANAIFLRGVDETSYNYVNNCVFDGSTGTDMIRVQTTNYTINECYFTGGCESAIRDFTTTTDGYIANVIYNNFHGEFSDYTPYAYACKIVNFKYNSSRHRLNNYALNIATSRTNLMFIDIEGNTYICDSAQSPNVGFYAELDTLDHRKVTIHNNTIRVNSECIAIRLFSSYDFEITNNNIHIERKNAIFFGSVNNDSVLIGIRNNTILLDYGAGLGSIISEYLDQPNMHFKLEIEGNYIENQILGEDTEGHAAVFLGNLAYRKVFNNYFKDCYVGGVVDKGANGTTEGLETQDSYYLANIFDSCGMVIKGVRNLYFVNNSIINAYRDHAITVFTNQDAAPDEDAANNKIYNNIINAVGSGFYALSVAQVADTSGFESDNNILFSDSDSIRILTAKSYTEYIADGLYDQNSFNTDPLLNASLVPQQGSDAIGGGINLGSPYNFGLDESSVWPDNITLKQQREPWTIGAYVVYKLQPIIHNGQILVWPPGSTTKILIY